MNKQQKIDLMIEEIMGGEQVSILFDPYENATDCMILWDKFSLGQFVEIRSYAVSNDWVARRLNKRYESDLECSAEGRTMIEAMCKCMFKAVQRNPEKFSARVERDGPSIMMDSKRELQE